MARLEKKQPCCAPGCSKYRVANGYCDDHQHLHTERVANSFAANAKRVRDKFGYNPYSTARWRALREHVRRRDKSLCQACLEQGRVVAGNEFDHIIAVINMTEPNEQFWDADNIRCLCSACHAIKTAKDQKEARQR
ncbi:TPA: HNH endonuclease [Vibrio parahaemolyticus]|uniref:HNH endonuclease n=1 Tax=Vibrio parahaemolyticus TaxID=670 RepID=UPI001122A647|nr:HNH endonuclease [Vibrio parahaemolyticus]TOK95758.1 hypothetical protein CGI06_21775 [Vibrio parahaemolyticus]HCG5284610.1 HNH endonuclease [Vibrio parahaemolyticus]HCG5511305.1 HNH endonuclease [Vibrio parahaemolyticus]HCG7082995.1 HNH endonuclease [Vibrio parahaemolyticus]HCH5749794.1 HNH endonuclease [Vibrio parahaemolyticus]